MMVVMKAMNGRRLADRVTQVVDQMQHEVHGYGGDDEESQAVAEGDEPEGAGPHRFSGGEVRPAVVSTVLRACVLLRWIAIRQQADLFGRAMHDPAERQGRRTG